MPHLVKHPSIILVIGGRGEGKSALSHHIIEKFHNERGIETYIVASPQIHKKLEKLLPKWIKIVQDIEECPEDCLILIDEASLTYHCHKWQKKETEAMDNIISISRHRKQTIIFITHITRKLSITLLDISMLVCKRPGLFHKYIERSGFKKILEKVEDGFKKIPKEDIKRSSYIISQEFEGFIRTPLCSYWSEELSEVFSGIPINNVEEELEQVEEIKPYPSRLQLKIWFRPEDKDKILDVILWDGKERLSEFAVICTADKCHVDFDLRHVGNGKYTLVSNHYNLEENLRELQEKKVSFYLDTETSIVDGEFYPISEEQLIFKIEKKNKQKDEQKDDKLAHFADNIEL